MHNKKKEIFIISFSHTTSDPYAMMIKSFNTVITFCTMRSSWWPNYFTRVTVKYFKYISFRIVEEHKLPVILIYFRGSFLINGELNNFKLTCCLSNIPGSVVPAITKKIEPNRYRQNRIMFKITDLSTSIPFEIKKEIIAVGTEIIIIENTMLQNFRLNLNKILPHYAFSPTAYYISSNVY